MRETPASFIATSVAGMAAAVLYTIYAIVADGNYRGSGSLLLHILTVSLPFELVAFLIGWPLYVVASSFGRARWWLAVVAGFAVGSVFSLLLPATSWLAFPMIGAIAGGAFWVTLKSISSTAP